MNDSNANQGAEKKIHNYHKSDCTNDYDGFFESGN